MMFSPEDLLEEILDDISDEGLDCWQDGMLYARSLEDVQTILHDVPERYADEVVADMKTFGSEPECLDGVWSWDDKRLLVGEMRSCVIVPRS